MLRPLYLDLLDMLLPLLIGMAGFFGGCHLANLGSAIFRGVIALSVLVVVLFGVSFFIPFPESINDVLWHLGGEALIGCSVALLLLGIVWSVRGRSTSSGFLGVMVGLVALILVLNSGGRLWWRTVSQATWDNAPNALGHLTQSTGWTCSPATATMLLHHYGVKTTEGEMAYLANTSYLGTDVRSIAQAMTTKGQSQGLIAQAERADYEACLQRTAPFLACVRIPQLGSHAVLVLRVRADEVELIDPRHGIPQKLSRSEFEPQWEGKIVSLEFRQVIE